MTIEERIAQAENLTPTELQLAHAVLDLGARLGGYTLEELAQATSTSKASIQRLCKKLGLSGFKALKLEMGKIQAARPEPIATVDVNFPFAPGDTQRTIVANMSTLYETTVADTVKLLEPSELERAARLVSQAKSVEIYTGSHNVYPAQMFEERLLSAGKRAVCPLSGERMSRLALASDKTHAAIIISYSGLQASYRRIISVLREQGTPIILVGSQRARRALPSLDAYLMVSDRESLQHRITQFASHIAVQFVLDSLFCCVFARDYRKNMAILQRSLPYTALRSR